MNAELVTKTNAYIANVAVNYVKLHNLHWNVVGPQFKSVHEYLETLYDAMADVLDETAEMLKMGDAMPLASMKEYLEVATIEELESKDYTVAETLEIVLADLNTLFKGAARARKAADEDGHILLASVLEDQMAQYVKNMWFIRSMLK